MPVFDLHQHLWPRQLIVLLHRRERPPYLRGELLTTIEGTFTIDLAEHELEVRLDALDRVGIDVAVVSLQPTLGIDGLPSTERDLLRDTYHHGIAELVQQAGGRLRAVSAGELVGECDGVCVGASTLLHPSRSAPLFDALERAGRFLFVHPDAAAVPPGTPPWWAATVRYPAVMQAAFFAWLEAGAGRWPRLPVVFAMLAGGAPFQLERLGSRGIDTRAIAYAPIFLETSSYSRLSLELCLAALGPDRLVHGSDLPVIDPLPTMSAIRALGKATSDAICDHNPSALLRRAPSLAREPAALRA